MATIYTPEAPPPVDLAALPAMTTVKALVLTKKLTGKEAAPPPPPPVPPALAPPPPAPPRRVSVTAAPGGGATYEVPVVKLVDCAPHTGSSVAHTAEVDAPTTALNFTPEHAVQSVDVAAAAWSP